jgi:hypothetical protein
MISKSDSYPHIFFDVLKNPVHTGFFIVEFARSSHHLYN